MKPILISNNRIPKGCLVETFLYWNHLGKKYLLLECTNVPWKIVLEQKFVIFLAFLIMNTIRNPFAALIQSFINICCIVVPLVLLRDFKNLIKRILSAINFATRYQASLVILLVFLVIKTVRIPLQHKCMMRLCSTSPFQRLQKLCWTNAKCT